MMRRWLPFAIVSAFFFYVNAATFTSLGVALPHMIDDLGWSYTEAGAGFSLLAFMVGLSAMVPAWIIRGGGIKATFLVGAGIMSTGFTFLATTNSLTQYFVGTAFAGFGYTLVATVPALHYFNHTIEAARRPIFIGAYFTIGGFGGVFGPLLVAAAVAATGSWRLHWWIVGGAGLLLAALAVMILDNRPERHSTVSGDKGDSADVSEGTADGSGEAQGYQWSFKDSIRTKEFAIIVLAMTLTLFCGTTVNSWAVTHMRELGVASALAVTAFSAHGLVNALSRGLGGYLGSKIDAKWLLVVALVTEVAGMLALAVADDPFTIGVFVVAEGFGFGLSLVATALLLIDYFGTESNPEIFGASHLITTVAMLGPVLAGWFAENIGGFGPVFMIYGFMVALVLIATILMKAPVPRGAEHEADQPEAAPG
ncbi:MAG: MFS transporter [Pseudomonadota bacterium]